MQHIFVMRSVCVQRELKPDYQLHELHRPLKELHERCSCIMARTKLPP